MILQRYVLREIVATFLMVFLTISLIIFIGIGIQQYRRMEGLGFLMLLKSTPFLFCYAMRYSIPAGTLMASVLVFGRLAAENEIMAIRAGGIPLRRIVSPALLVGLSLTLGFLLFNDHVAPRAIHLQRQMARQGVLGTLLSPPPLGTSLYVGDNRIHYSRYLNGLFEELSIGRAEGKVKIGNEEYPKQVVGFWAQTARFVPERDGQMARLQLHHVIWLSAIATDHPWAWPIGQAQAYEYPLDTDSLTRGQRRLVEMTTSELLSLLAIRRQVKPGPQGQAPEPQEKKPDPKDPKSKRAPEDPRMKEIREILAERHQRLAWAFGPLVLTLLGAPIGILLRKGNRLAGFGASLPGGTVYFLLATMGQVFGAQILDRFIPGNASSLLAIWIADILFFLIGAVLLWRVNRI